MLRQQFIVLRRQVKRPQLTQFDRIRLVLLARFTRFWQQALHIVQPDTLLRWHRDLFRHFWRRKSRKKERKSRVSTETIALIKKMAKENLLWGAERIRGELLKLNIEVSKRTIQKTKKSHPPGPRQYVGMALIQVLRIRSYQLLCVAENYLRRERRDLNPRSSA